jgi:uncharacterized membrane protein YkoI
MMKGRRLYVSLGAFLLAATAVGGGFLLTSSASAGQGPVFDDGKELLSQANVTLPEAIAAAQTAVGGEVGEIDLEYYNGALVFNVDIGDQDVKVDANSGVVLGQGVD